MQCPVCQKKMAVENFGGINVDICKEGCKGLCDICGKDLNKELCVHQKSKNEEQIEDVDSPLARALRKALSDSSTSTRE